MNKSKTFKICKGCPNPGDCISKQRCAKEADKPGTKSYKPSGK